MDTGPEPTSERVARLREWLDRPAVVIARLKHERR
jgi:hypothetical protein